MNRNFNTNRTTRKNPILMLIGLLTLFIGASCSSIDAEAVKKMDNVAVSIIGADKFINMGEYSGVGTMIQRLADDESFNLDNIVRKLHEKTFNDYTGCDAF